MIKYNYQYHKLIVFTIIFTGENMKRIINLIKKIIFAVLLIYSFNMLYGKFQINIPLNLYTILLVTILGFPGFCSIIFLLMFLF